MIYPSGRVRQRSDVGSPPPQVVNRTKFVSSRPDDEKRFFVRLISATATAAAATARAAARAPAASAGKRPASWRSERPATCSCPFPSKALDIGWLVIYT